MKSSSRKATVNKHHMDWLTSCDIAVVTKTSDYIRIQTSTYEFKGDHIKLSVCCLKRKLILKYEFQPSV